MAATSTNRRPDERPPSGPSREAILRHVKILKDIQAPREVIEIAERAAAAAAPASDAK